MSDPFVPKFLWASEYVLALHDSRHRVAVLARNRSRQQACEKLLTQLADVQAPAGPTPRQLQSGLVQIKRKKERRI